MRALEKRNSGSPQDKDAGERQNIDKKDSDENKLNKI